MRLHGGQDLLIGVDEVQLLGDAVFALGQSVEEKDTVDEAKEG